MVIHNICQWFINLDYTRPTDHDRSIKVSQEIIYTARLSEVPIDFRSWASRSLGSPCGEAAAMASSGRAGAHSSWAGCSKHWAAKSMSWTGHGDKQKLNVHNGFGLHHCCILFVIRRQTQENTSRLLVVVPEKCGSTLHAWIARERLRLRWQHGALLEVPGAYKCTQQLSWLLQTFGSYPTLIGVIPVISYYIPLSLAYFYQYPWILREIIPSSSTISHYYWLYYVGIPSLILAKWRKLFWASKGRDALKPNFNKWPEEPFLPSRNGSSGHLLKFGFKASRPLLAKWRKLRHLCPKKDNSDVFPGGFASCPGTTLMIFFKDLNAI